MARRGHRPINRPAPTQNTLSHLEGKEVVALTEPEAEVVTSEEVIVHPDPPAPREKTLHELNLEARAVDRWHEEQRRAAQAKIDSEIGPMMRGVVRGGRVMRRTQKPLRPPVKP